MTYFHAGRHRAPQQPSTTRKAGLSVAAAAAFGLAAPAALTTSSASAATATTSTASVTSVASVTSTTSAFSGIVGYGDRGSTVREIQRVVGTTADGIFGPATLSAVKRYQRNHDLAVDGVVGPRTGSAMGLGGSTSSTPERTSTRSSNFTGIVSYGDRGSTVREIQRVVGTSADGVFGPATLSAVKRFQAGHGLTVDGVVGPRTGSAMGLEGSATTTRASRTDTRTPVSSSSSLLGTAAGLIGTPYSWGGTTPSGFDCSGFTQYVFARHGISLPRTAEQQRRAATRVSSPQPGDLVFFGAPAWHVGIYAGNGMMYDSGSSGSTVTKRAIWTSNVTYGRV